MTAATVPVVVVTHAGLTDRLRRCLASLADAGGVGPVVVVDNSGRPSAPGAETSLDAEVIRTTNRGYGAAANVGFAAVRRRVPDAPAVALLNDDIEVDAGWLPPLTAAIGRGVDVVQPKLLVAPRSPDPVVNSVGVLLDQCGAGVDIGFGQPDSADYSEGRDIEIFTGGAVLFSFDFIEATGGFDERYFLYYEDVDLALRGVELGRSYRCEPASTVWHEGGASTDALGDDRRRMQERNRLWCAFRFAAPVGVVRALWLSVRRLRHAPRGVHARALWSGLAGAPRRVVERRAADRARLQVSS